jgi:hypothetical protein
LLVVEIAIGVFLGFALCLLVFVGLPAWLTERRIESEFKRQQDAMLPQRLKELEKSIRDEEDGQRSIEDMVKRLGLTTCVDCGRAFTFGPPWRERSLVKPGLCGLSPGTTIPIAVCHQCSSRRIFAKDSPGLPWPIQGC